MAEFNAPISGIDRRDIAAAGFYQPSIRDFAQDLADARRGHYNVRGLNHLPSGRDIRHDRLPTIGILREYVPRFRRVPHISAPPENQKMRGAKGPARFRHVAEINSIYGSTDVVWAESQVCVRFQSYCSTASPPNEIRHRELGGAVSGDNDCTSGNHQTPQLVGRDTCDSKEWESISPTTHRNFYRLSRTVAPTGVRLGASGLYRDRSQNHLPTPEPQRWTSVNFRGRI